jgi:hypothetical protein
MSNFFWNDLPKILTYLLPLVIALVISLKKENTVLKFYLRKICGSFEPKIDCGKDLE